MKLMIVVGGGGHFSPALAVINTLPKDWDILVVGRKYTFEGDSALSLEYQTALRMGIPFKALTTGRLQRVFSKQSLRSLLKIPLGNFQAYQLLRSYKPDVVLSFGGYVSVPIALAAKLRKIPIVIHEQTVAAGMANKFVAKFARKVCISWEESAQYFPITKVVLTGNPIRTEFVNKFKLQQSPLKNHPTLYVTGGSGGAHSINVLIEGCLDKLLENYYVIHQTGDAQDYNDFERIQKKVKLLPETLQKRYFVKKFIKPEEVCNLMNESDLVVSRSGINTVTELLYLGKPSLLIPLPFGQQNEQKRNAEFLQKTGIGKMYEQQFLTPDRLFAAIQEMLDHYDEYSHFSRKAHEMIPLDAAENIISVVRHVTTISHK